MESIEKQRKQFIYFYVQYIKDMHIKVDYAITAVLNRGFAEQK